VTKVGGHVYSLPSPLPCGGVFFYILTDYIGYLYPQYGDNTS